MAAAASLLPTSSARAERYNQFDLQPIYISETGHHLKGNFQSFWRQHRNGYLLGLPITEVEHDNNGRKVQYFENARLEEYSEYEGTLLEVQLGMTGDELIPQEEINGFAKPFDDITVFYEKYGGFEFFGYPLSIPLWRGTDVYQYMDNMQLVTHRDPEVPEYLVPSYKRFLTGRYGNGFSKLIWPGMTEALPLGRKAVQETDINTKGIPPDPHAIILTPNIMDNKKKIEVNLTKQTIIAYEDPLVVLETTVSTGRDTFETPIGTFPIIEKVPVMDYRSPFPQRYDYTAPEVPFNLRVRWEGEFIHGTYWHDSFGKRISVGCINLNNDDAFWMYQWARRGTPVEIKR